MRFPVVVLYCKRKPAGLRRIAEALRIVTRRVTGGGLQVDYRSRASLGRRHDNLVSKQVAGPAKVKIRKSEIEEERKKQSPPGGWKNLQKSGTELTPLRAVFEEGRRLDYSWVQSFGRLKERL